MRNLWPFFVTLALAPGCHRTYSIGDDPRGCRPDAGAADGGPATPVEVIDLASDPVGRTFLEPLANRQLSTVAVGDVTGDGAPELLLADAASDRSSAGTVYATSVAGLLDGSTTELPSGTILRVVGASAGDRLGVGAAGGDAMTGDVTGDGIADLILGAPLAGEDGSGGGESRIEAGEVYVLTGGPSLTGDVDLAAAPAVLRATLFGAAAGDQLMLLSVGDATGDGVADLVLGAPWADEAGVDSGAVYVVPGGATLTGAIDLATSEPRWVIRGPMAGARFGSAAALGELLGPPGLDLVVGDELYSDELSARGAVFAFAGPIDGDREAAAAVGAPGGPALRWNGAGTNDHLGRAVAIGNVVGDAHADIVLGAYQQRCGRSQLGALNVWDGATLAPGSTLALADDGGGRTAVIYGGAANDAAGISLALGDLNGDGYLDLPVASGLADGPDDSRDGCGEVVFFLGGAAITGTIDLATDRGRVHVYGAAERDALGLDPSAIVVEDLTGDGHADVCLGSFQGGIARGGRVDCFASPL